MMNARQITQTHNKREQANFPTTLHFALSEIERDGLGSVISWQPHGRCFLVRSKERFVKELLPLWFRQSHYSSFQRQLNLYGFRRFTQGRDKGGYWHPMFVRENRALCANIKRVKVKGNGPRKPGNPETEPDFYGTQPLPTAPAAEPSTTRMPSVLGGRASYVPVGMEGLGSCTAPQTFLPIYNPGLARALLASVFPEASERPFPTLSAPLFGSTMDVRSALALSHALMGSQQSMLPNNRTTSLIQTTGSGGLYPEHSRKSEQEGDGS